MRDLLSSNSLIFLFLNFLKELIINCSIKNANELENTNKKARLKMLKDVDLFR